MSARGKHWTLALVILVILSLGLAACDPTQAPEEPMATEAPAPTEVLASTEAPPPTEVPVPEAKVGTTAHPTAPGELDPSLVLGEEQGIMLNVYETLTFWDPEKGAVPRLATSWESNEDGTEWTFHLREGVAFHDGTPFTAEAVKFSFERTIEKGALSYVFASFDQMEIVDDLTLRITTLFPSPLDKIMADGFGVFIMSPSMADMAAETIAAGNGIGTGPYMYESYDPGQRLVLTRYDDYWGGWEEGQFSKVVYQIVEDPTVREQMLRAGEAVISQEIPYDAHEGLAATGEITAIGAPAYQHVEYLFKLDRPPLDDVRVRQALAYAFPYEDARLGTFGGQATISEGAIPRLMWPASAVPGAYTYDLEKAQALLEEAGYGDGLEVEMFTYAGATENIRMSQLWQAELAKIGVDLAIQEVSLAAIYDIAYNPETDFDIFLQNMYPGFVSPSEFICSVFHGEWTWIPFPAWNDPDFNAACETALMLEAADPEGSDQSYAQAEQILYEQAIAIFPLDIPANWAWRNELVGFEPHPLYMQVIFWHDLSLP